MTRVTETTKCLNCGNPLPPNHTGPCPRCGKTGKTHEITIRETIHLSDRLRTVHEFYEENPTAKWILILITIVSPLIGFFLAGPVGIIIGLIFDVISYFIGPKATTKVKEIWEKG